MTATTTQPSTDNATTQRANRSGAELAAAWTDMLLAGMVAAVAADYAVEVALRADDTEATRHERALAALVARIQANHNHYMATKFPTLTRDTIYVAQSKRGQRFLRIWAGNNDPHRANERTVVGFVEPATGLLWKAATWKAPALNFSRGSMYDLPVNWAVGGYTTIG